MTGLKTLALAGAMSLGTMSFAANGAFAQTAWDMPTPYGDSIFHTANIMQFADDVREATGGSLDITVHSAGSLFGHPEIKDAVRRQLAPIGEVLISRLSNENPLYGVDSIPFLATSYDEARALWEASEPAIATLLEEEGLRLLFAVPWPPQGIYAGEEVTDASQMDGVRFRAYNAATERLATLMGAVPTQVEAGDIPTAFSTGRVDAMITSPSTGVASQAWDFVSVYHDTRAWLPKNMVIVNQSAFDALSTEERDALLAAADEAETRGWAMSEEETVSKTSTLADNGMSVVEPSDALAAQLAGIGQQMTAEWAEEAGPSGLRVIEAYRNQ
ncbi:MAG: TRAP transporter substrate-binding protein [Hyphomicrobiales bacterium]|jgi:TRAP-type C4-dicarboxylate transport system substrate-binding protein